MCRIHIYDVQEKGKYHDGFKTGNVLLKIRKNDDDSFRKKFSEITEKVKKMGMTVKKVETSHLRPQ
jgi:hypothetical protein